MTMVLGRPLFRNDMSPRGFGRAPRPMLKIACPRYSYSADSGKSLYESYSHDVSSASSTSSKLTGTVSLSTPSPSATANGNRVDKEFEKLRRLSEEWLRNREIEEAENTVWGLGSRSPSPQRGLSPSKLLRRSSSQPAEVTGRDYRSPSPTRSPERYIKSPPASQKGESSLRSLRSRSPSPLVFSPLTKTFVRSISCDSDSAYNSRSRSTSPRESSLPASLSRRSSIFSQDRKFGSLPVRNPSPQRHSPVSSIFRRSSSYDAEDAIRSNFRARSTSPQRLTPASSYYRKHSSNVDDRDSRIYASSYHSRSPSPQSSSSSLDYYSRSNSSSIEKQFSHRNSHLNSLRNFYNDSSSNKYHSLPRNLFSTNPSAPKRDSLFDLFSPNKPSQSDFSAGYSGSSFNSSHSRFNNLYNNTPPYSNHSKPPLGYSNRPGDRQFLPYTLPDLSNYRMTSPRRFSEEPSPFRRPLATLHEDDVVARRRFSEDIRKKSFETPDVVKELNDHQRKLSEAGVRKQSDASLVLTSDTDSFIIGDRVWVGGTKPGSISYIGETQFAPGEWAGVTLDEPIGKNNGTVAGVRYFQCEAKKGVFSRLTRLSRSPMSDQDLDHMASRQASQQASMKTPEPLKGSLHTPTERKTSQGIDSTRKPSVTSEPVRKLTPSSPGNRSPLSTKSGSPSPAGSVKKGPAPTTGFSSELRIGERVVIDSTSGTKYGVLRYLGRTDFADGVWAGVELDEPTGKNDGSVAGKKYFCCRSKFGLFAPMSRVRSFAHRSSVSRSGSSALPTLRRSGSKESLGASSAASSNVSLRGTRRPSQPSRTSTSPSTKALQETLAEKTQHVDQLMRERDSDRGEMAKIATRLEETTRIAHDYKRQLDQLQIESEERLHDLGEKVQSLEMEKKELAAKIEDKKKEIDDLNFRIEEETFAKADFESQNVTTTERLKELEGLLGKEKKKLMERGEREARKEDEMEEIEISLRGSVEELQAKVMELERDKEVMEERWEEALTGRKELETEVASLTTSLKEKEQKISLMETAKEDGEAKTRELEEKTREVEEKTREVEEKTREADAKTLELEELLSRKTTQEAEHTHNEERWSAEINELKEKLECGADTLEFTEKEVLLAKEDSQALSAALEEAKARVATLEEMMEGSEEELQKASQLSAKNDSEIESLKKIVVERDKEVEKLKTDFDRGKEELIALGEKLKVEEEKLGKRDEDVKQQQLLIEEMQDKLNTSEKKLNSSLSDVTKLEEEVKSSQSRILELEDARRALEAQLEVAVTSSSASSDELKEAKVRVEEAASRADRERESLTKEVEELKETALTKEKDLLLLQEEKETLEKEMDKLKRGHETTLRETNEQKTRIEEELKTRLEEQVKNYKNLFEQFESNSKCFQEQKEQMEQEKQQALDEVSSLNSKLSTIEREKAELLKEKEATHGVVASSDEVIKGLTSQLEALKGQLTSYKEDLEKQKTYADEDQRNMAVLKSSLDESQKQLNSLEENLSETREEMEKMEREKSTLTDEVARLKIIEAKGSELSKNQERLEREVKELDALRERNSEMTKDKINLEEELKKLITLKKETEEISERNEHLRSQLEDDLRCVEDKAKALRTGNLALEERVTNLTAELTRLKKDKDDLTSKCQLLETAKEKSTSLETSHSLQEQRIKSLELDKDNLLKDLEGLKKELEGMKTVEARNEELLKMTESLKMTKDEETRLLEASKDELKKSFGAKVSDLETEKASLVEEVVTLQDRMETLKREHEEEVTQLKAQAEAEGGVKSREGRELAEMRLRALGLESDRRKLETEVKTLKEQIALSGHGSGEGDEFVLRLKQERDQFEGQVNFLNSVIVDLQRKKDDLEVRVEVLQSGNLPDDQKANMNGLSATRAVAPRLFCDICDCFDLHDTEDCPTQTSGDSPPHSHYGAPRHAIRPYCDSCEVFGHEEGDCPLDETF